MGQHLRILHCLRAPVGGLFRHVLDLAAEEARLGHGVGIIADSSTGDALTAERFAEIKSKLRLGLHLIPMSRTPGLGDLAAAWQTMAIARREKADVVHGHGAKGGAYARLAAAALKATGQGPRSFYTPHGGSLHFDPTSLEGRVYLRLEKLLGRVTDGLIFESSYSKRIYEERIGFGRTPVRVVPNGLGPDDFAAHAPAHDAAEFLFVGELRHLKGVDVLLEALAAVNRTRPARAVIVGGGPDAEAFKAQARSLGLSDCVDFPGVLPARKAFTRGRCLIVPSRAESFPYIVLEAAASGIPLIATNVGGIPEIVNGTDTELIAPANFTALTAAMQRNLDNQAAAEARAQRLRAEVARKFTIQAMASAVLHFQCTTPDAAELALKLTEN